MDLLELSTNNDEIQNKTLSFGFAKSDFMQFLYLLQGYLRANAYPIRKRICPIQEIRNSGGEFEDLDSMTIKKKFKSK
jgi:hypothetical protein